MERMILTDEEWEKILPPDMYAVARKGATECAFTGALYDNRGHGIYVCLCCGLPLFTSDTKFNSGTGWPSFFQPVGPRRVIERSDNSLGMHRTEVLCARCEAHLGHVFNDGPAPTGLRYCTNSLAMQFVSKNSPDDFIPPQVETAAFGAGCFWGVEEAFRMMKGVVGSAVGYMGGTKPRPTYEEVCLRTTGHAETVYLVYDPKIVSYGKLLDRFWEIHDPTSLNRQGNDVGSNYRSVIFYYDKNQEFAAREAINKLNASGKSGKPIVTEVVAAPVFWRAEEYHQRYLVKNPHAYCHIDLNSLRDR